jgi:hypothetical protein
MSNRDCCGHWRGAKQCWDQFRARDEGCVRCFLATYDDTPKPTRTASRVLPWFMVVLDQGFNDGYIHLQDYISLGKMAMDYFKQKKASDAV